MTRTEKLEELGGARTGISKRVKIIDYDTHRNGISGIPFTVLLAEEDGRRMLIVRFDTAVDKLAGGTACAVF